MRQTLREIVLGPPRRQCTENVGGAPFGVDGRRPGMQRAALIGMGVVLLVLTIAVGALARGIVTRYDRKSGAVA